MTSNLKQFPVPIKRKCTNHSWDLLVLGIDGLYNANGSLNYNTWAEITETTWSAFYSVLSGFTEVDISTPTDRPWMHFRRTPHINIEHPDISSIAQGRIEVLRIKKEAISKDQMRQLEVLLDSIAGVTAFGWWPDNLDDYHVAFPSLLQKLTYMRSTRGPFTKTNLAYPGLDPFLNCLMFDRAQPWFNDIQPWLEMLKANEIPQDEQWNYWHWFGHIGSGWEPPISKNGELHITFRGR